MAKVLVTSIGLGRNQTGLYDRTSYKFPDEVVRRAIYFPGALTAHLRPDIVIMLLTSKAREVTWLSKGMKKYMDRLCGPKTHLYDISISDGASETELWDIFLTIATGKNNEGDFYIPSESEVYLDITHALRSLPLVILNALGYIAQARSIDFKEIYYAAFESVPAQSKLPKPVFALHASLLFEWSSAVAEFKHTGDSTQIATLIENRQKEFYANQASISGPKPTRLKSVADKLQKLSLALDLARPLESMDAAFHLLEDLQRVQKELYLIPPFTILYDQVGEEFKEFALAMDEAKNYPSKFLSAQYVLIHWFYDHHRYLAAIINTLEWIVTYVMIYRDTTTIFNRESRDEAEKYIRDAAKSEREDHQLQQTSPLLGKLITLWDNHKDVRNDVAHVGMREEALTTMSLRQLADKLVKAIPEPGAAL